MSGFQLHRPYQPAGDQITAISELTNRLEQDEQFSVLLWATGTGKTFTMANVIQNYGKPTLVIAHNKTLTAQLAAELRDFFPQNAVDYFVSYYDYYQPEAYNVKNDTYIEKDSLINEEIDTFRHKATVDLLTRKDVIIVASVSCIYGLGDPAEYENMVLALVPWQSYNRTDLLKKLISLQYERNDTVIERGKFSVKGDVIDIFPSSSVRPVKIEFWWDEIDQIRVFDPLLWNFLESLPRLDLFPAKHALVGRDKIEKAAERIRADLKLREAEFQAQNKLIEAQRIRERTEYDIDMMLETGYCNGIENYGWYFTDQKADAQPFTLFDFFPDDFLLIVDESHITLPQIGAMYEGNKSRKQNLIDYGFRLPTAHFNRPLRFEEFLSKIGKAVFVSATPRQYELELAGGEIVEQVIRPTGLLDPQIQIRPTEHQMDDLLHEIRVRIDKDERTLITTLTKKQAEDLTVFLSDTGILVEYIHSDVDTLARIEILRRLRLGEIHVVIGVNLLREGLDLPEVSLIAILDADKQGFLRSRDALLQSIGRVARNANGLAILYADSESEAMKQAISETYRRRAKQEAYNTENGITPQTIRKPVHDIAQDKQKRMQKKLDEQLAKRYGDYKKLTNEQKLFIKEQLAQEMEHAVEQLDFETAAELRDMIQTLDGATVKTKKKG